MAGIAAPTFMLLVAMTIFSLARFAFHIPVSIERIVVFPMAVVPNAWGLWNVLYLAMGLRGRISLGIYGAALPIFLIPLGMLLAWKMDLFQLIGIYFLFAFPVVLVIYYVLWDFLVGFFNETLEIA
jgi:hypothetical protein